MNLVLLFGNIRHMARKRSAPQLEAKVVQLIRCADRIRLDSAIAQISDVTTESQSFRRTLRKVAEADTLHRSRDEEALRLFCLCHKPENCSRHRCALILASPRKLAEATNGALVQNCDKLIWSKLLFRGDTASYKI
jgi:hypothetical protein